MADATRLDLDRFLPYLLNVLASRVSRELAAVYQERFGISVAEWRVIAHLAQAQAREGMVSVREIHGRVDMDKVKVSRAAARLEAAGLIRKGLNASDRRLVSLSLTQKGRRLFAKIAPLALRYERRVMSALSAGEEKQFRSFVARLLSNGTGRRS